VPKTTPETVPEPAFTTRLTERPAPAALALGAGVLVAVGVALLAGNLTGATSPVLLVDPGAGVRWGILVARVLADVAAALTVGVLIMAAVALPSPEKGVANRPALAVASVAGTAWAAASLAVLVLTFADISGLPIRDPAFGRELAAFAMDLDLGRQLTFTTVVAAVIGLAAAATTRLGTAGLLAVVSLVALTPAALGGHAAGDTDHETAVTALGLHLLGVCVWFGGLATLVLLAPSLRDRELPATARRYSALAGWAFVAVALSGLISAWLRLRDLENLTTSYGVVVLVKSALLIGLGGAGLWHRRRTLADLEARRPRAFAQLAVAEIALMAAAVGLGAALARTAPPATADASATPLTPAEVLTGYALPPEPTAARWLTQWQPDLLWVLVVAVAAGCYLAGVRRLHARGDRWPVGHTIAWLLGLVVLLYATCGAPAVYGRVLFSGHMIAHMVVSMIVPPLLVLGAPVTLALRALRPRTDATRGPREWLLAVLGSVPLRVLAFPPVAATLFAGSLIAFYYTDLFELALTTHVGHELMYVHFLLAGYLFAWLLIGVDPGPHRPGYPLRLVVLFATMAFHAFFGVTLVTGSTLLQPDYFIGIERDWGRFLLEDQRFGGSLAWGLGEIPTVLLAIILVLQWARSDDREARRRDRAADRDGDAELKAYNEMLRRLAARDS
jgi:cytochrome c oxidase assembly factor CtaG